VTNTGKYDADEVVQVYISKDDRTEDEPFSSLRGFCRVFIPAGKSQTAEIKLLSSAFETVNADGEYQLAPGIYTIIAADASPVPVAVEKGASVPVTAKVTISI
jgi:beta-glucosidase